MKSIFTVPFIDDGTVKTCAFKHVLPDRINCPYPGFWIEFTIAVLSVLQKHAKVKFTQVKASDNQTDMIASLMETVKIGTADVAPAMLTLTYNRAQKLRYLTPFLAQSIVLVTNSKQNKIHGPQLDLARLYPKPIMALGLLIVGLFGIQAIANQLLKRHDHKWFLMTFWTSRFSARNVLMFSVFTTVIINTLGSHVVITFSAPLPKQKDPFRNIHDLAKSLETKGYSAVTNTPRLLEDLLNPVKYKNIEPLNRFVDAAKHNKPQLKNVSEAMDMVLNSKRRKFVFVTISLLIPVLKSIACDVDYITDHSFYQPPLTMYVSANWTLPVDLNRAQLNVIHAEYDKLSLKYENEKNPCFTEQQKHSDTDLTLPQIEGSFYTLLILNAVCILVFIAEGLVGYVKNMSRMYCNVPVVPEGHAELGHISHIHISSHNGGSPSAYAEQLSPSITINSSQKDLEVYVVESIGASASKNKVDEKTDAWTQLDGLEADDMVG